MLEPKLTLSRTHDGSTDGKFENRPARTPCDEQGGSDRARPLPPESFGGVAAAEANRAMTENGAPPGAVFDTNLFVAAGFHPRSSSARLLQLAADGQLQLVWSEATRRETAHILRRIPRLRWEDVEPLFRPAQRHPDGDPGAFDFVEDPDDRKFAALAAASGTTLVTSDDHLLRHRGRPGLSIATPSRFLRSVEEAR